MNEFDIFQNTYCEKWARRKREREREKVVINYYLNSARNRKEHDKTNEIQIWLLQHTDEL